MNEQQQAQALDLANRMDVKTFGTLTMTGTEYGMAVGCEGFRVMPSEDDPWEPLEFEKEVVALAARIAIAHHAIVVLNESIGFCIGAGSDIVEEVREKQCEIRFERKSDNDT